MDERLMAVSNWIFTAEKGGHKEKRRGFPLRLALFLLSQRQKRKRAARLPVFILITHH
jgi:hypothetical protein